MNGLSLLVLVYFPPFRLFLINYKPKTFILLYTTSTLKLLASSMVCNLYTLKKCALVMRHYPEHDCWHFSKELSSTLVACIEQNTYRCYIVALDIRHPSRRSKRLTLPLHSRLGCCCCFIRSKRKLSTYLTGRRWWHFTSLAAAAKFGSGKNYTPTVYTCQYAILLSAFPSEIRIDCNN